MPNCERPTVMFRLPRQSVQLMLLCCSLHLADTPNHPHQQGWSHLPRQNMWCYFPPVASKTVCILQRHPINLMY